MKEAYDFKVLGERLKAKGLIQAEEMAEDAVVVVVSWLKESAILSPNKYDDLLAAAYPLLEAQLQEQAEKISDHDAAPAE